MGIFYNPPQPVQGTPHAPIPAQGQQPPRVPGMPAVTSRVVREAWEPPPPQPTQKVLYVPIPAQGNPPPVGPGMPQRYEGVIKQWWVPPDPQPTQKVLYSSPANVYGDQPPPYSVVLQAEVRSAWEPPPPQPYQLPLTAAPLTLVYGQQPPGYAGTLAVQASVRRLWEPPDPQPQRAVPTVPIPRQGDQPPPHPLAQPAALPWWQDAPPAVQPPVGNAAWNVPAVVAADTVPYTPLPAHLFGSWPGEWWPAQQGPPTPMLSQGGGGLLGGQPPRIPGMSRVCELVIGQSWEPAPPQPAQKRLLFPTPPISVGCLELQDGTGHLILQAGGCIVLQGTPSPGTAPYSRLPALIAASWPAQWWPAQSAPVSAVPSLPRGDRPPPYSVVIQAGLRQSWEPPPPQPTQKVLCTPIPAQGDRPQPSVVTVPAGVLASWQPAPPLPWALPGTAAWNVPAVIAAVVPYSPLPPSIVAAWPGEWWPAQRVPTAATARQPRGDQPPPYSVLLPSVVRRAWEPPDPQPRQLLPPSVPIPAQGGRPAPSPVSQPPHVTASWPGVWWPTQSTPLTAPLSLVYGQQPPRYSAALQAELRSRWEPDDTLPPLRALGSWLSSVPAVTGSAQPLFGLFFRKRRQRDLLRRKDRRRDTDLAMAAWLLGED